MSVAAIRDALHQALAKIGYEGEHACPKGNNTDPFLHELYIANEAVAHFKNRKELALASLGGNGMLNDMPDPGTSKIMAEGATYDLYARVNQASKRLDKNKLKNAMSEEGLTDEQITSILLKSQKTTNPARYIEATPKGKGTT